jgi:hypothetical protein
MKIALCFIISYDHILNKEDIWRKWIEPNKDIINIYFYYKDLKKIKSAWIKEHIIPEKYIFETSYYHVIPAYMSSMNYAFLNDSENKWFCLLTDSCCPIISPKRFRSMFYKYYNSSIMNWRKAWWNVQFHKRANLALIPEEIRLGNDAWFVLKRENVLNCINFIKLCPALTNTICDGGLANESLFAIIMYIHKQLETANVIQQVTHITDWSRMSSSTSPHLFRDATEIDIKFIDNSLETNKYAMFIRKIAPDFPDDILNYYIYEKTQEEDDKLLVKEPAIFIYNRIWNRVIKISSSCFYYGLMIILLLYLFRPFSFYKL